MKSSKENINSPSKEFVRGASSSINKTIKDIEDILNIKELEQDGELRENLRNQLRAAFQKVAIHWLEHGFLGGHVVAADRILKTGKFPNQLTTRIIRNFYDTDGIGKEHILRSELPRKYIAKLKNANIDNLMQPNRNQSKYHKAK